MQTVKTLEQKNTINKVVISLFVLFVLVVAFTTIASAITIPQNLQKLIDYTSKHALSISLLIAFLGGVLSILSPCILPIMPAFFAYTFGERKNITKMTFAFFSGTTLVFILLGFSASLIGKFLLNNKVILSTISGLFLLVFGLMLIFNKGFRFIKINPVKYVDKHSIPSVFIFGVLFAIGFTPCIGPILASILFLAAGSSILSAGLLLFMYSLGLMLPLFIMAYFYDKYNFADKPWIAGKEFTFAGLRFHSTKLIAGLMLAFIGTLYLTYKNTSIFNIIDPLRTKDFFYSTHRFLIEIGVSKAIGNLLGIAVIIGFGYWGYMLYFNNKRKNNK